MKDSVSLEGATNGPGNSNQKTIPKMNAFQFMMNSRNRSIGRNSPGRELDLSESTESALTKQRLKARKSHLESWAEKKGAAKRKRHEEEIDECINHKLEKRERRFKNMLALDVQSDDEVITKRRKRCPMIVSDTEDSGDKNNTVKRRRKKKEKTKQKSEEDLSQELTPKSLKAWKFKIKLQMDESEPCEDKTEPEEKEMDIPVKEKIDLVEEEKAEVSEAITNNENADSLEDEIVIVENQESENRRVLRTRKPRPTLYEDSDSDHENQKGKKAFKVAPVFLKACPKPKLDPKEAEARRQFLLSGIPSSLKKEMVKQQCVEEVDFDVFPTVSHVQQKCKNIFWSLPKVDLNLNPEQVDDFKVDCFSKLLSIENLSSVNKTETSITKIKNCKKIIKEIKTKNPDYPVYKFFNSLYSKSGYKIEAESSEEMTKPTPRRRGRPKKSNKKENALSVKPNIRSDNVHALWTEKYKPSSSSDIIGNHGSVSSLKEWLKHWFMDSKKKDDSESEFDVTDGDSRDSGKMIGNTVVLRGPTGSGKTAAVYAICNELGFEVLEVNASSRRTGKRLLQELQEATQSHQVCKKDKVLSSFIEEQKEKPSAKMCVLLIEDVDIVFEQDEGFCAALSQIITTTKRPVILTCTDEPNGSVQKIINNYQTILFSPLSSILTIWLQIVCLVEGYYLTARSLDELLNYNRGDARRSLLQLQLYVNSGGQLKKRAIEHETPVLVDGEIKVEDDSSNLDLKLDESNECTENVQIHDDCVDSCHLSTSYKSFSLPSYRNLGVIWWNLPSILTLPNVGNLELDLVPNNPDYNKPDRQQLNLLSQCYETLSFADTCGSSYFHESLERRWRVKTKNGLGLEEVMADYKDDAFYDDFLQILLGGSIEMYKKKYEGGESQLNMAVPNSLEKKWRQKHLSCEERLQEALLPSDCLDRKSLALDYLPYLRTVARLETERAANNSKRGNRFYSYLRNLGLRGGESTYKSACDVFKIVD